MSDFGLSDGKWTNLNFCRDRILIEAKKRDFGVFIYHPTDLGKMKKIYVPMLVNLCTYGHFYT